MRFAGVGIIQNPIKGRFLILVALALVSLVLPSQGRGQVLTKCAGGVTLKLSAASVGQGSLLLADVIKPKTVQEVTAEWGERATPLWVEDSSSNTLHSLLGVDLEKAAGKYEWKVSWKNGAGQTASCSAFVIVKVGKFPTENLKVEKQFVEPDPEQQKRAAEDQKRMKAIYDTETPERLWDGPFRLPLKETVTGGNFGRRRVLNGQARSPHAGVDFPSPTGTPVFAAQSGKVVLAENLYYSGNTVVLDHGFGIYTLYAHLSAIEVQVGQNVQTDTEIGKVGATGRVTGPHLHWGLTIQHARVNAMQVVQRMP
jgi:hypothetical protein